MEDVGTKIRQMRKSRKFTQEDIAHLMGWPMSKVSKIETNTQEITYREFVELEYIIKNAKREAKFYIPNDGRLQHV